MSIAIIEGAGYTPQITIGEAGGALEADPAAVLRLGAAALVVTGISTAQSAGGGLEAGRGGADDSTGACEAGRGLRDAGYAGAETRGYFPASGAEAAITAEGAQSTAVAPASAEARYFTEAPDPGALIVQGKSASRAPGGIEARALRSEAGAGALEVSVADTLDAPGALVVGSGADGAGAGALEVETGAGVDVIVDIVDATIAKGRGDGEC